MAWTQEKIEATLKSVVEKAQADPSFREKLKQNPREVLASEGSEAIPEFIRIAIVDQNDADIVITLPKVQTDELSDADLEQVAGGKGAPSSEEICHGLGEVIQYEADKSAGVIGKIITAPYIPVMYLTSKIV